MIETWVIYWGLLALCCGYALWRGRGDERVAAAVCLLASIITHLIVSPRYSGFEKFEGGVLAVDAASFAAFTTVALTSSRFWPLWIAGLQLTTLLAHMMRMLSSDLIPVAYAAAGRFWSYPILLILVVGTWRHRRRSHREARRAYPA